MYAFVRARYLLPFSETLGRDRRIEDGYVLWRGDEILEVGPYSEEIGRRLVRELGPNLRVLTRGETVRAPSAEAHLVRTEGVLLPGFIKAHGHDHEPPIIGLVKDVPLTRWLDGVVNPFTRFMSENRERLGDLFGRSPQSVSYLKARLDDLHYGITTTLTHHCNFSKYFADDLIASAETSGTRLLAAVGSQDRHYAKEVLDTPEQAVARLDAYWKKHGDKTRVSILPGPDQLFSNGPEMLKAQKAWAREHGTLFHCHSAEEKATTAWFRETYRQTEVEYARDLGILDEHTLLAHQVHTTEGDLGILAATGTRIAHNPLANTILGSGMPPVIEMLARGIPVAISTDGSGSADNQNILAAARLASQYQKAVRCDAEVLPAQKVLEMITVEPAKILRVDAGSLEPGKAADLVLLALDRPNMVPTRACNLVENLVWASDGSEVRMVVAGGRLVRDGDTYYSLDTRRILDDVQRLSEEYDRWRHTAPEMRGTGVNV